jgi:sarcosine oxidase delta subunit
MLKEITNPQELDALRKKYKQSKYLYWVENHLRKHSEEWLDMHDGDESTIATQEYVTYVIDKYIEWVSNGLIKRD